MHAAAVTANAGADVSGVAVGMGPEKGLPSMKAEHAHGQC